MKKTTAEMIEEMFLASLTRFPTEREREALVLRIDGANNRREALEDLLLALVNAKEFMVRQ